MTLAILRALPSPHESYRLLRLASSAIIASECLEDLKSLEALALNNYLDQ